MSASNFFKWPHLRGAMVRRVVLRALMFVLAVIVLCLMQMAHEARVIELAIGDDCSNSANSSPSSCGKSENLTRVVLEDLMEKKFLQSDARVLCVGERSASAVLALRHLGFFSASGVYKHPFFSLLKRRFVYELDFDDDHFDFVFSEDLDRVSIPSLLVMEMERVIRPGGAGAILVTPHKAYSNGEPLESIATFLKSSDVVHVCSVGVFRLMVFKKRTESYASFEHFKLPPYCPSIDNNKEYMKHMEPLTDEKKSSKLSYLPEAMNISSRNKMIYVNLGAGEYAKTSVSQMSKSYHSNSFEVYIIDHKTSVLSSFVMDPSINFVYHPALAGATSPPDVSSDEFLTAPMDEEGFDFVEWFKETVSEGDFVVLMMKAKEVELNILVELFASGAICHVDEMFLRCSDSAGCMKLYRSLRRSGVYVHQWLGD